MAHRPATAVAQLTVTLGTLTAFAITLAAPATALPQTQPHHRNSAPGTPLSATDRHLALSTKAAAPTDWAAAGPDLPLSAPPLSAREAPLTTPLTAGIDALSAPFSTLEKIMAGHGTIPYAYKEFLPAEVTEFYSAMTYEERAIVRQIARDHAKYETEEQALEALKARSEKLYTKAVELRQLLKTKLDALNPAAKAFIDKIVEEIKALKPKGDERPDWAELRKKANEIIEQYRSLSEEAKESLKANFPKLTGIIQNGRFQQLAHVLLRG